MNERLDIYKTFVVTITANEGRRQRASTAYLDMCAVVVTVVAAVPNLPKIVPALAVFIIALTWLATVSYFRKLAQAKFAVIEEIEKELVVPAFVREWQHFNGKRRYRFFDLTHLEMMAPSFIAIASFSYIVYWIGFQIVSWFR